jgi:hypothetical protein
VTEPVAAFQVQTEALAADNQRQVLAVYTAWQAGQISQADAELAIAGIINRANAAAVTIADVFVATQIEQAAGVPTPATGVPPVDDSARLVQAAHTILSAPPPEPDQPEPTNTAPMRLDRLARSEPLETAQRASVDAMAAQPLVEGWTRQMDADPCQLCRWWWREGRIWPKEHPFQSHKGCNCQPKVVLAEHIQSTGFTRQLERNRAS